MKQQGTWIRFSVNGDNIKAGSPYAWRSFIGENPDIPLKDWRVKGLSSHKNPIPANVHTKDKYGVLACVAYFGTYSIKDDIMYIELEEPAYSLPWGAPQ